MTRRAAALTTLALCVAAAPLNAQAADSARVGVSAPAAAADSILTPLPGEPHPPISAKRALFQSLLVPGWGQASLDRGTAGAIFVTIEVISVAMVVQSKAELNAAVAAQSVKIYHPATATDSAFLSPHPIDSAVVGKRRQAVEDWTVLLVFNHLIAAADAFVAWHLWNVPIEVKGSPATKSASLRATLRW